MRAYTENFFPSPLHHSPKKRQSRLKFADRAWFEFFLNAGKNLENRIPSVTISEQHKQQGLLHHEMQVRGDHGPYNAITFTLQTNSFMPGQRLGLGENSGNMINDNTVKKRCKIQDVANISLPYSKWVGSIILGHIWYWLSPSCIFLPIACFLIFKKSKNLEHILSLNVIKNKVWGSYLVHRLLLPSLI